MVKKITAGIIALFVISAFIGVFWYVKISINVKKLKERGVW